MKVNVNQQPMNSLANGWTPERRERQAALIRNWRPWEKSTGPKTDKGKAVAAMNAYKGGERELLRLVSRFLREQEEIRQLL